MTFQRKGRASRLISIAYECSHAVENKPIFEGLWFAREARHFIVDKEPDLGLTVLFTIANVIKGDETKYLDAPISLCQELVRLLNRTSSGPTSTKEKGFTGVQLAKAVLDLIRYPGNIPRFVNAKVVTPLIRMLDTHESNPQECALNAIWSLTTAETHGDIRCNELMEKLRDLVVSPYPEVKQAARRLLIKMDQFSKPKGTQK